MSCEHQWRAAISWVHSNHILVRSIAAPYSSYMASGNKDVDQEAILTAFSTLTLLAEKGEHIGRFGAYFRVLFRTRCIKMATGGMVTYLDDINQILTIPTEQKNHELDREIIEQALQKMTNRQRQIFRWVLSQPHPVNMTKIARQFGIEKRAVRYLLSNAIRQVKKTTYENTPVRKNISVAA